MTETRKESLMHAAKVTDAYAEASGYSTNPFHDGKEYRRELWHIFMLANTITDILLFARRWGISTDTLLKISTDNFATETEKCDECGEEHDLTLCCVCGNETPDAAAYYDELSRDYAIAHPNEKAAHRINLTPPCTCTKNAN